MLRAGLDHVPLVYVVPRADGRVLVGATSDDQGFAKSLTVRGLMDLLSQVGAMLPELRDARVLDHWSGLRPQSGDGLPLLGVHREVGGLIFAAGHHRNGILLTPVTADATVNSVLGLRQRLDLQPFAP
jgi:glycine oxidase